MKSDIKTPEEIQRLKENWLYDPCWDIYETEGFELYSEELKAYQENVHKENSERYAKKLLQKSVLMGIDGNIKLTEYITKLEMNIDFQNEKIEKLQSLINR